MPAVTIQLIAEDPNTQARAGLLTTPHGEVPTPAFMPVGTQATVKGVTVDQLKQLGASMILGNTYHLGLRPGHELIRSLGGLHRFSGWDGPILTDSGGFQIFSLAQLTKITEHGATFKSHIDGRAIELTPELSIDIQESLGSDVAMVLDHVIALPNEPAVIEDAMERSIRWAKRCLEHASREDQARFAIVQGGLDPELRRQCAQEMSKEDFEGFAIGGLSVGEPPAEMYKTIEATVPYLPKAKPRYLMGVGTPIDLVEAIARGVDMFDCVMPTRNGRNALAFTATGSMKLRNAKFREDARPLEEDCPCPACRHSRAYIRHLFVAGEMLGPILLSIHNLTFYQRLVREARAHIQAGTYSTFLDQQRQIWTPVTQDV
ncbi:Queuine tRNA-ribosyltransferase [Rosistilla oblonga]|uniref:Queuine tRNA-ribosyltransferase n=1 Tax=Rosistilla oblonga TaxID=2527990 RepID=A0A518IYR6_9BACT|nr:tRNA guanosine(34) transglycosylase Tgt [Rosistilla oblonga]QDV13579.1 Queuine tRNA-ribosyltransferase [Rosistilla oblonga]QDV58229.1 Queuine tRNA-ribosyltransferase [Rosistilla oblonga]